MLEKVRNFIFKTPTYYFYPITYVLDMVVFYMLLTITVSILGVSPTSAISFFLISSFVLSHISCTSQISALKRNMKMKYENDLLKYKINNLFVNNNPLNYSDVVKEKEINNTLQKN